MELKIGLNLRGWNFRWVEFYVGGILRGWNFRWVEFSWVEFSWVKFSWVEFSWVEFSWNRFARHSATNDVIKRVLRKAGQPSILEPPGLDTIGDGSRPDDIIIFPFSCGSSMVWDCTCIDNFAGARLNRSAMEADTAANCAEERKRSK